MKIGSRSFIAAWLLTAHAAICTAGQLTPGGRSFDLASLQQAAVDTDPRLQQLQLLTTQTELRLRNIAAGRLPSVTVDGQAQYQSDVPRPAFTLPGGSLLFTAPKATYDSGLRIDQRIFDASINAQDALERAQLAEQQARVRTTLFSLRQQVNEAFFTAAALQARQGALAAAISDLSARLDETNERVAAGTALPAEAASIEATLLQRRQDEEELRATRRTALARLAILTGQTISENDALAMPDLAAAVSRARQASGELRARPEYDLFARTRERVAKQQGVAAAQERPRVSTFARIGFGRPGLNFITDQFESYGLGGVRVQWNAWTWGSGSREREALAIQQQIVAADQAAFAKGLSESIEGDAATVDRLQATLALDDRILVLREQIERSTQARFQEGVVTASEFLDRSSELLQARFARATHQVELAQAGARLLTTLGLEVR
jgi:outer membrane protein TolC